MAIHRIVAKGEVITPLFMGGNMNLELRVPALRGGLRYWLRTLLGSVDIQSVMSLKTHEANVFGDTERQSAVTINLIEKKERKIAISGVLNNNKPTPIKYLWYIFQWKDNQMLYKPGTEFSVEFISRDKKALAQCVYSLWCLSFLGGLGARSRRAAGSVQFTIEECDLNVDILPSFNIMKSQDLITFYQSNLSLIRRFMRKQVNGKVVEGNAVKANFDSLHKRTSAIYTLCLERYRFGKYADPKNGILGKPRNYMKGSDGVYIVPHGAPNSSWENAVAALGIGMQDYRLRRGMGGQNGGYDYDRIKKNLNHGNYGLIQRVIFGLPLTFRFHKGPVLIINRGSGKDERQASPMWLKVVWTGSQYEGIATIFDCRMDNLRVVGKKNARSGRAKAPQPLPGLKDFITSQFIYAQELKI